MSESGGWPSWRRDNPAGLLAYVSAEAVATLLTGLPPRAAGRDGDQLARLRTVYEAFAAARIRYADEPIASTGRAQQIRPPGQVLVLPGGGNCLDLSIVFAGACLYSGLHPLLVVCEQGGADSAHAVVVVWLGGGWPGPGGDGRYPAPGPVDSPLVLTSTPRWPGGLRQAADSPGQFLPVDVTQMLDSAKGRPGCFEDAVTTAAAILSDAAQHQTGTIAPQERAPSLEAAAALRWRWEFGLDIGLHYRPETALDLPRQPTIPPLDAPYQDAASIGDGPLAQVRARGRVVPFIDRGEMNLLLEWCLEPDGTPEPGGGISGGTDGGLGARSITPPVRIAVIEGVGGSGKTRLAAEVAQRLADEHNWYTGFAVRRVPVGEPLGWLARVVSPVLVVVDYVEAVDMTALIEVVRTLAARRGRTVLLFTARTRGGWWERLNRELTSAGVPRSVFAELRLPPRPHESARLFSRAYRHFTAAADSATYDEPPLPVSGARWTALDLVMLAWLAARVGPDLPATPADLYEAVIGRELDTWADAVERGGRARPTAYVLRIAAASVSLLSPSPARLTEVLDRPDVRRHTSLAPGEITESLAGFLGGPANNELDLTPDPIADYLLLTAFPGNRALFDACVDFIDITSPASTEVTVAAGRAEPERFCDNLTRAGEATTIDLARAVARDLATTALRRRASLWPAAFETALNRGGAFTAGLEELAARDNTPLPLREIDARIPTGHSDLRQLALIAVQKTMSRQGFEQIDHARVDALIMLAVRLSEVGRREEALGPAQEAVTIYRQLAEASPGTHLAGLARALNILAVQLSGLGRPEEALGPAQEAVTIYRQLAEASPGTHLAGLAQALNNLAVQLSGLGRPEEALGPAQEAVTLRWRLAEASPGAHLAELAGSLSNLAKFQSEVGRREAALGPAQEAVTIHRQLAEASPGAYLGGLATSLSNLAKFQSEVGRREEALGPAQEAVAIHRQLAEASPGAYLGNLATSLSNLAKFQSELGRPILDLAQEAVTLRRRLAEASPGAYLGVLAASLHNLAMSLSGLGRREEALGPAREAVTIYRQLAEASPGTYLANLATSLNGLAILLSRLGRREEALGPVQEAVTLYRRLAEASPGAHLGDLAGSLSNLAKFLSELGRREEALGPVQEAVTLHRRLAEASPGAYLGDLATSLDNLASQLWRLERPEEALGPAQEAVTLYRRLAEASPGAYLANLAASLNNLPAFLSAVGRPEEALGPAQEAVTLRRRLAEASPGAYLGDLAASLTNLSAFLSELGRQEEALGPAQEGITIYRQLAEASPGTYLGDLAISLNNLPMVLSELGRTEEALGPAQEAVTLYRRLAEASPGAYLANLAASLSNLPAVLSELRRPEEALGPAQEAVAIYRQLAQASPGAYLGNLAASLNNLAMLLSELGRREEALGPVQEAVTLRRRLAEASPGAYLGDLAMSLSNLAMLLSELGRREEALGPAQEAVAIYRQLAQASPGAYLGDLAASLGNQASRLSEVGRREEALASFEGIAEGMAAGPRAEIHLALADWLGRHPGSEGKIEDQIAIVAVAATVADSETDPVRGARARRAVRAAASGLDQSALAAELPGAVTPPWISAELPDDVTTILNKLLAAGSWTERAAMLRGSGSSVLYTPAAHQARAALVGLYSDNGELLILLKILEAADERGLDAVLAELCADEEHANLLQAWLNTPTWTTSRQYLLKHPSLLVDKRTAAALNAASGNRTIRQHLAIVRLAATIGLDEVYDIVMDPADAADVALANLDKGELNCVVEIWNAAPSLRSEPFTGGYIAAILLVASGHPDDARRIISEVAPQAAEETRQEGAERLRRIARLLPEHENALTDLAELLTEPTPPPPK